MTDICGQLFGSLQEARPEDDSVVDLFGQYEQRIVEISRILDDASARDHYRPEPLYRPDDRQSSFMASNQYGRAGNTVFRDRQALLGFLKR